MKTAMKTIAPGICLLALLFSSCEAVRNGANTLSELQQVQQKVVEAAGTNNVNVNLNNGKYLQIKLVNTPFKDLPAGQKSAKAREIAQAAYRGYSKASELEQVSVVFVVQQTYGGVLNYSNGTDAINFTPSDLSKVDGK
jgi:hypothetical protein